MGLCSSRATAVLFAVRPIGDWRSVVSLGFAVDTASRRGLSPPDACWCDWMDSQVVPPENPRCACVESIVPYIRGVFLGIQPLTVCARMGSQLLNASGESWGYPIFGARSPLRRRVSVRQEVGREAISGLILLECERLHDRIQLERSIDVWVRTGSLLAGFVSDA